MGQSSEVNDHKSSSSALRGDAPGCEPADELIVERHGGRVSAKWNIARFAQHNKGFKVIYSKYFEVGGYDCRLLVYPTGDAQALPGYMSIYLQISDPGSNSSKWDCFASYQLAVRNLVDDGKSIRRDSWHRFSAKKRSHGWCDFAGLSSLLDAKQGFMGPDGTIQVSTDITILDESVSFSRENDLGGSSSAVGDVYSGKFTWKVRNFSAFQPLLRTQKIMSPAFPAGECALRMSVYQSTVGGVEYLSLCLESKDAERASGQSDRTAWCLFRLAVHPQIEKSSNTIYRDSYGRFACDSRGGDNTSLGWNDFLRMNDFLDSSRSYLIEDTAVFSTTFHVIRETTSLVRTLEPRVGTTAGGIVLARPREKRKAALRDSEWSGRFQWRLENFTRLKELLKKRKITGLCIKSKRFTIGGRDCRLIVYPRGQSQPPTYLSVFLEVSDPHPVSPDWSAFVSHRLSVVNQRGDSDRSVSKESQNRYSRTAKDWGWREFVSLTTLFDADAGFLVNDAVVFSAEVLVLKESLEVKRASPKPSDESSGKQDDSGDHEKVKASLPPGGALRPTTTAKSSDSVSTSGRRSSSSVGEGLSFKWRIENFSAFKDVIETRKIFSQYIPLGPCDVRVGLYESFDSLCVYLESDAASASPPPPPSTPDGAADGDSKAESLGREEKLPSYWVRYRVAILNQRHSEKTQWREGSMYTRSWNNSVVQFPRAIGSLPNEGIVVKDCLILSAEILDVRLLPPSEEGDNHLGTTCEAGSRLGNGRSLVALDESGRHKIAVGGRNILESEEDYGSSSFVSSSQDDEDDDEDDDDDGTFDDSECDFHNTDAEVEDALARWLSAAGVDLLSLENRPPVLTDAESAREALEDILESHPGAIPMFVASLRMYLSSLQRVKRLFLPCLSIPTATDVEDQRTAPAVITLLASVSSLRQPLINMLVDVMLDHTLTAKMHRHLVAGKVDECAVREEEVAAAAAKEQHQQQTKKRNNERIVMVEEISNGDEVSPEGRYLSTGTGSSSNSEASSSLSKGDDATKTTLQFDIKGDGKPSSGGEDVIDGVVAKESGTVGTPPATPGRSARISGSLAESPLDDVEQTLGIILGWMRTLDFQLFGLSQSKSSSSDLREVPLSSSPLSPLHKVSMLLADAPKALQPDVIALVPRLVGENEHTAAAGALLGRLAEASREGPEAEAHLRLPVLAALGSLHINPLVAHKVLQAALEALPHLSASELPPAVGLVLKLSSDDEAACKEAVVAVRHCIRQLQLEVDGDDGSVIGEECDSDSLEKACLGAVEALRLAAAQQFSVANLLLETISESAVAKGSTSKKLQIAETSDRDSSEDDTPLDEDGSNRGNGRTKVDNGSIREQNNNDDSLVLADIHVILDCLSRALLSKKAARTLCTCTEAGILGPSTFIRCLERRKTSAFHLPSSSGAMPSASGDDVTASIVSKAVSSVSMDTKELRRNDLSARSPKEMSVAQRMFILSHPGTDPFNGEMPRGMAHRLGLLLDHSLFWSVTSTGRLTQREDEGMADELDGFLMASEMLLCSGGVESKRIGLIFVQKLHHLAANDVETRRRIVKFLAELAFSEFSKGEGGEDGAKCWSLRVGGRTDEREDGSSTETMNGRHGSLKSVDDISDIVSEVATTSGGELAYRLLSYLGAAPEKEESAAGSSSASSQLIVSVLFDLVSKVARKADDVDRERARAAQQHAEKMSQERASAEKLKATLNKTEEKLVELQSKMARREAELHAELAGVVSDRRGLQAQVRTMEQQLEWVKSERDEERSIRARENREFQQRLEESDAQLQRLKTARRDEQRRVQKDKNLLMEKIKALEDTVGAAESRATAISREAELASSRKDKLLSESKRRMETAEQKCSAQETELIAVKRRDRELEMQLRAALEAKGSLERRLQAEQQRLSLILTGVGLQNLPRSELEALIGMYESGLHRANSMLMSTTRTDRGHMPGSANPVPTADGSSLRPQLGALSPTKIPYRPGALQAQGIDRLSAHKSLESMQGMGMEETSTNCNGDHASDVAVATAGGGNGSLFGVSDWNIRDMRIPTSATNPDESSLLGLLPSDLLFQS